MGSFYSTIKKIDGVFNGGVDMELLQIAVDKLIRQVKLLTSEVNKLKEKIAILEKQQLEK